MVISRIEQRTGFTAPTRIRLLEQDADEFEAVVNDLRRLIRWLISAHLAVVVSIIGALCVLAFK